MRKNHATILTATMMAIYLGLFVAGCEQGETSQSGATEQKRVSLPDGLLLDHPPTGVTAISQIKQSAKEGDQVVLRGVVGGRVKPIVDNRAVMTVVDASTSNQCTSPNDMCTTPWDYCCESPEQLKPHLATVQIVDDHGHPLTIDLTGATTIKPMSVLVVKGEVSSKPNAFTLVVNARGLFVESIQ